MKILIVSQYYYPEQFVINDIAETLAAQGHRVTVLTGLPTYPQGTVLPGYENGQRRRETIRGVDVIRCREADRTDSALGIGRNYLSFLRSSTREAKRMEGDFDVVFVFQVSPITSANAAVALKRRTGVRVVLYCLDIFPEALKSHVGEGNPIFRIAKRYSRKIYNACDVVAVTSEPFRDYLEQVHGVDPAKIASLPQYAPEDLLGMDLAKEPDGKADFMFAGNIGYAQNLDTLVLAAEAMEHRQSIRIHIVGDGSRLQALQDLVQEKGLEDVFVFHGRVDRDRMGEMYRLADVLILTLRGDNFVANTIPGKLQTYLTTGKPIFGAVNGESNRILNESGCGKAVPAGDFTGLARLMDEYAAVPDRFSECGQKGKQFFLDHFTKQRFFDTLMKLLEKEEIHEADERAVFNMPPGSQGRDQHLGADRPG